MEQRVSRNQQSDISIHFVNIYEREGFELQQALVAELRGCSVQTEYSHVRYRAEPGHVIELIREIFIFMNAHKGLCAVAGYVGRKSISLIAETVKKWAKSRSKGTYSVYLYNADGEPVKRIEIKNGKERMSRTAWKDYARECANDVHVR